MLRLIHEHNPQHVSIIGGEPLVRHKELSVVLPLLSARGVHLLYLDGGNVQWVTWSARPSGRYALIERVPPSSRDRFPLPGRR